MGLALALLDGPAVSALGCCSGAPGLKLQGAQPLFTSIALALVVASLPVQPYDAVRSLKKPHETGQVC